MSRHKFTNVYRAADRVSQYLIRTVIYDGPQDRDELIFRILLFKVFNRIETWELLASRLGAAPSWDGYSFAAYNRVLGDAIRGGEPIYSAAYITPNPPFGEPRKHGNHLRLLEHAMASGLPARIAAAATSAQLYELLLACRPWARFSPTSTPSTLPTRRSPARTSRSSSWPARARWTASANASPTPLASTRPRSSRGCATPPATTSPASAWTSRDLWGRWPTLIDWQNVFCEVSKYTRATHPHIQGRPAGPGSNSSSGRPRRPSTTASRPNGDCRPSGQPC